MEMSSRSGREFSKRSDGVRGEMEIKMRKWESERIWDGSFPDLFL